MSYSFTRETTFTRTHAISLGSKIAADLRQMQLFYGRPTDKEIEDYWQEVIVLLLNDYLASVSYGFKKCDEWIVALKYSVSRNGLITTDDRSGRVPPGKDISAAYWYSFLTYSATFFNAPIGEREQAKSLIPVKRIDGQEPSASGIWTSDKTYSNGGVSLGRQSFSKP